MSWRLGIAVLSLGVLLQANGVPAGPRPAAAPPQDPQEPPGGKPSVHLIPPPASRITSADVDRKELAGIIHDLVACGTRSSLSPWDDPNHGIGCGRDRIVARFQEIAKATGGALQVKVDRFEASGPRSGGKPIPLENVIATLPGTDPALAKTVFLVSGHFDSRASDVMDAVSPAPGADDDGSGVAVSIECARLLTARRPPSGYRATLIFAAVSGEEQGLFGSRRLVKYLEQNGYTVGGMLDDDIVGADFAPGAPHRARLFSAGGRDGVDSPSRELARAVEEIDSAEAIRLIFREDRLGRGGDHMPFIAAGDPAVRFTEPLEDYRHEHQTPRVENGIHYGDLPQYLNYEFMADVVRDNAEALRELALAPAPPVDVTLSGAVTPSAVVGWQAPGDPDRAGFEILWRETTSPRWSVYDFAPAPGESVLTGVSTDKHFFAVRAVGKNGAGSLAVPALPRRRVSPAARPGKPE